MRKNVKVQKNSERANGRKTGKKKRKNNVKAVKNRNTIHPPTQKNIFSR